MDNFVESNGKIIGNLVIDGIRFEKECAIAEDFMSVMSIYNVSDNDKEQRYILSCLDAKRNTYLMFKINDDVLLKLLKDEMSLFEGYSSDEYMVLNIRDMYLEVLEVYSPYHLPEKYKPNNEMLDAQYEENVQKMIETLEG